MSGRRLSCITSDTCNSRYVVNAALRDLAPGSEGLIVTLNTGSRLRTFTSYQLVSLSCSAAGDNVNWDATHGRGNCRTTIQWPDLSRDHLSLEQKRNILDKIKRSLILSHIALAETITIAPGKGLHAIIVWKEPVMTFELQILDTELRGNLELSKIADISLGSLVSLGPVVIQSEMSSSFSESPVAPTGGSPPPVLANAVFTS